MNVAGTVGNIALPGAAAPVSCSDMARRSPLVLRSAVVLALLAVARPAGAHPFGPPPTAELTVDGGTIEILWRARADDVMALATSVGAFAEQPDEGRPETGAEIVARSPEVRRYLVEGVVAFQGGMSCHTDVLDQADLVEGGARLRLTCPRPVAAVEVEISLLHDLHESYRTLLSAPGASPGRAAFTSTAPRQRFAFARVGSPVPLLGSLVARLDGTAGIAAIGLALIAGLLHGLGPGHAKLAGAALLAGSPGTRRRAAALGGIVAGMHAASTIALAAALYSFTRVGAQIERVTGWLQLSRACWCSPWGSRCWLGAGATPATITDRHRARPSRGRGWSPSLWRAGSCRPRRRS